MTMEPPRNRVLSNARPLADGLVLLHKPTCVQDTDPVLTNQIHCLLYDDDSLKFRDIALVHSKNIVRCVVTLLRYTLKQSKNEPCKQNNTNSATLYFVCSALPHYHTTDDTVQELTTFMK